MSKKQSLADQKNPRLQDELTGLTDAFCDAHLNQEYKELCRAMALMLCEDEPSIDRGKLAGWAAGIVNALGFVNFLSDPETQPYLRSEDVARGFGVSVATMLAKSRVIRDGFELCQLHPDWCLSSLLDQNPLVWMLEVNGLLMDVRSLPREFQVAAFEKGLIPYVPADRAEPAQAERARTLSGKQQGRP